MEIGGWNWFIIIIVFFFLYMIVFLQIPISTLNAVNELLQGIGGTFGASG